MYLAGAAVWLILVIGAIVLLGVRQLRNYEVLVKARAESDQRIALDAAINDMSQGLVMFDAAERIVVSNRRYIEMYDLSPDVVKPGLTARDLLLYRRETGSFAGDIDRYLASCGTRWRRRNRTASRYRPATGARSAS